MPEDKKKLAIGAGLVSLVGLVALAARKPPILPTDIVLSDLVISPSEVYAGEPVSISVTATNVGESAGSYQVTCEVE